MKQKTVQPEVTITEAQLAAEPQAVAKMVEQHERVVVVREGRDTPAMVISRQRGKLED